MIRTVQNGKQLVAKLALHRETVRVLGARELEVVVGAREPNCTAESNRGSGCPPLAALPLPIK